MGIEAWSTTAASNNASPPDGAPEGQTPGSVNNVIRQCMASVREWYEAAEWVDFGHVITRTDNDTFSVPGDLTALYQVGRRLKVDGSATGYCTISASTFSTPNTIVDVTMDSGNLPVTLSTVYVGMLSVSNHSLPSPLPAISGANLTALNASNISSGSLADARLSSNVPLKDAANTFARAGGGIQTFQNTTTVADTRWRVTNTTGTVDFAIGNAEGYVQTVGAIPLNFYVDSTLRGTISAAGNWTINAPSSGAALTSLSSGFGYALLLANVGHDAGLRFSFGSNVAYVDAVDDTGSSAYKALEVTATTLKLIPNAGGVQIGSPTGGDKGAGTLNTAGAIYQNNVAVALSTDFSALNASNLTSGTVPDARFPATLPAASGVNLTALNATNIASGTLANARLPATINVATDLQINSVPIFASGTFTATLTGCTTSPTGTATWYRAGNIVTLVLPSLSGISNATTCTVTGLPAGIQPATLGSQAQRMGYFSDNGTHVGVFAVIQDGSGTISFFRDGFANFTTSGTKAVGEGSVLTYLLT
jgi:hypothetical protein